MKTLRSVAIYTCLLLFIGSGIAYAQPGFDDDVDDVPIPVDGGVSLLVAAGVGFGIKKLKDAKAKNN